MAPEAEGSLDPVLDAVGRTLAELGEASAEVDRVLSSLDAEPGELDRVEERLFAYRALARKHQVGPDDLPALAADLRARLAALDAGAAGLDALEAILAATDAAYAAAAADLSAHRRDAASRLDRAMAAELPPLKLERARFATLVEPADPGPDGADQVRFTVATNPGAPAGPIDRIASGGELSRFLLALKVCLSARAPGLTLVFDEIDRGVGGATADAVGRRLSALGAGRPGPRRHPLAAGRRPRRPPLAGRQDHRPRRHPHRDRRPRPRRPRRGDRPHARRRHRHRRSPRRSPRAARRLIACLIATTQGTRLVPKPFQSPKK